MLGEVLEQVAGACVPFPAGKFHCSPALGFSFSSLVWDLLSPELRFATLQQ